ncbi:MAG: hypothetical protein ACLT3Y_01190 [Ruminococcus callidus]
MQPSPSTGDPLTVVDLPGYGYAKVAKSEKERWSGLIPVIWQQIVICA